MEAAANAFHVDAEGRTKTPEEVDKIYKKLQASINELPSKYRAEMAAIDDLTQAREYAAKITKELADRESERGRVAELAKAIDEKKGAGKNVEASELYTSPETLLKKFRNIVGREDLEQFYKGLSPQQQNMFGGNKGTQFLDTALFGVLIQELKNSGLIEQESLDALERIKGIGTLTNKQGQ